MSTRDDVPGWLVVIGGVALLFIGWIYFSYFEARAYENVTGKKVSTFDAMFLNLRVQEEAE